MLVEVMETYAMPRTVGQVCSRQYRQTPPPVVKEEAPPPPFKNTAMAPEGAWNHE
jgi:hypothetical protein